jgi:hypothetical protein
LHEKLTLCSLVQIPLKFKIFLGYLPATSTNSITPWDWQPQNSFTVDSIHEHSQKDLKGFIAFDTPIGNFQTFRSFCELPQFDIFSFANKHEKCIETISERAKAQSNLESVREFGIPGNLRCWHWYNHTWGGVSILDLTKSVFPSVDGFDRNLHTGDIMPTLKGSSKFQQSTVTTFGTRKCLFYNRINHQFIVRVNLCKWCLNTVIVMEGRQHKHKH